MTDDPHRPDRPDRPDIGDAPTVSPSAVPTVGLGSGASPPLPESIGRYQILGLLGEGGMGVVYEAEQPHPKRRVALKVIRGGAFVDETRLRLFQREADTLARLEHPNIAAIYESGRTEDGQHFFAMELVRGDTLSRHLRSRPEVVTPKELRRRLGTAPKGMSILGPATAPFERLRGQWRAHLLIRSDRQNEHAAGRIRQLLTTTLPQRWLEGRHKGVRIKIDMDPISLL